MSAGIARFRVSGARLILVGLIGCCLTAAGAAASSGRTAGRAVRVHPPAAGVLSPGQATDAAAAVSPRSAGVARRGVCSPREPFAPPVVARLAPAGVLVLDGRHGRVIVVSSATTARATTLSVAAYDAATGALIRSRRIASGPVMRATAAGALSDELSAAIDEASGRVFVLHAPYGARLYPRGRLDVLDADTLAVVRRVRVGAVPRPPVVAERAGRVYVANQRDGTLTMLDARSGQPLRTIVAARGPLGPSAPPVVDEGTGRVFFAADAERDNVVVLDARSGAVLRRVTAGTYPQALGVDRRDNRVLVAGGAGAVLLDARSGATLRTTGLVGVPRRLLIDELGHRAFISYGDNVGVSMLDTATGSLLRTTPVRLDHTLPGVLPAPDQAEAETYPLIERVDERRRWVVVRVPQVMDDDGPEQDPSQIAVLDSRTATRIHTIFSEPVWPDAVAVDERRGRAFSDVGGAIAVYDISCLTSYYIFGDMG